VESQYDDPCLDLARRQPVRPDARTLFEALALQGQADVAAALARQQDLLARERARADAEAAARERNRNGPLPVSGARGPAMAPAEAAPRGADLEARMRELERKLDRILQALDGPRSRGGPGEPPAGKQ
jgi:hypothetical protein